MPATEKEHALVDSVTLARRVLDQVKHQVPGTSVDALLMVLATIIVQTMHQRPAEAQRMAAICGKALRDAVGREARDALAATGNTPAAATTA